MQPIAESRLIWLNQKARNKWEGVISHIANVCQDLEFESVVSNQRDCGTITADPAQIFEYQKKYPHLIFRQIRKVKKFHGFSHQHQNPGPDDPYYIHYVYSLSNGNAKEFENAYNRGDHDFQGLLLGFPECCRKFFKNIWPKYPDPIYQMGGLESYEKNKKRTKYLHPLANPLLRYLNIRTSFHIPCSFDCDKSILKAENKLELMKPDDQKILSALLSMPMTWDCYHGIAIIKTPIFWITIGSNMTKEKYIVEYNGEFIPREMEPNNAV
jgi:hypothetical protein